MKYPDIIAPGANWLSFQYFLSFTSPDNGNGSHMNVRYELIGLETANALCVSSGYILKVAKRGLCNCRWSRHTYNRFCQFSEYIFRIYLLGIMEGIISRHNIIIIKFIYCHFSKYLRKSNSTPTMVLFVSLNVLTRVEQLWIFAFLPSNYTIIATL